MKYKVWECKIVVPDNCSLPDGFDWPPRAAACNAISSAGIPVVTCFSGWGGELTEGELNCIKEDPNPSGVYYAGVMDTPENVAH